MDDNIDPFKDVLKTNSPDKEIEYFWLNFKDTLINNIQLKNYEIIDLSLLDKWSKNLNKLKEEKNFKEIETEVYHYLIIIAWKHIINYKQYYYSILMTNIKRWNRIASSENQINLLTSWSPNQIHEHSLIGYLIEVLNVVSKNKKIIESDILSILNTYDFDFDSSYKDQLSILDEILIYSLNNRLYTLVDLFSSNKIFKFNHIIQKKYGIVINKEIKANKLFKLIDKIN
jgi:hypothetical protein